MVLLTSTSIENLLRRTAAKPPIFTLDENVNGGSCDKRPTLVDNDIGPNTNDVLKNGEKDQLSKAVLENTGEDSNSGCSNQRPTLVDNDIAPDSNDVLVNDETDQLSKAFHENTYTCLEQIEEPCDKSVKVCKSFGKENNSHPNSSSQDRIILDTGKSEEFNSSIKDSELSSVRVLVNESPQNLKALDETHGILETVETSESVKADIVDKERVSVNDIPQNLKALDGTSKAFKFCGISEAVETSESVKADIVVKDTGSAEDKTKQQLRKETIDLFDTSAREIIVDETVKLLKDSKMQSFVLLESHYIKLGETDSYICVFEKQHRI